MQSSDRNHPAQETESSSGGLLLIWQRQKSFLLAAILVLASLMLYAPVVHHQFINFDDPEYVFTNPHVVSGLSLNNIRWAFSTLEMGHWHPLAWLSHMLACQLFGVNPAGHHYLNVLLHAANVLLLFLLLKKATGSTWRSFMVAALFAFHPLNVESVAWVSERKGLLSAFFCFGMLAAYGWYTKAASWQRYLVVAGIFVLALMTKAMAVTMPLALLLIDYWPLGRFSCTGKNAALEEMQEPHDGNQTSWNRASKLFAEKIPLLLLSAVSSYLAVIAQKSTGTVSTALPFSEHLKNAAVAYVAYIGKAFWPAGLAVYYPYPEVAIPWSKACLAMLVLALITAGAIRLRRERFLVTGWLYFLLTLLPVIGLVQVGGQSMADRYSYLPTIGLFIVVVWGSAEISKRWKIAPAVMSIVACCVLATLAVTTRTALEYWQDSVTLFTRAEQVVGGPNSLIEVNLGRAYNDIGQPDDAFQHFEAAKAVAPHSSVALYNIGTYLVQRGHARESIPEFQAAIAYSDSAQVTESSLNNLGSAYLLLGDYRQAERAYTSVLQLNANRYRSLFGRGQALYAQAKFGDAANDFSRALRISPSPQLFLWLGKTQEGLHKDDEALAAYNNALNADPNFAEAKTRIAALRKQLPGSRPIQ